MGPRERPSVCPNSRDECRHDEGDPKCFHRIRRSAYELHTLKVEEQDKWLAELEFERARKRFESESMRVSG